jgi:ornithine carbamoyltransferase
MLRHFLDLFELTPAEACRLIDFALVQKGDGRHKPLPPLLPGRTLGMIFEKPSLRTRVSFEAAIARLGGNAIFLRREDVGLGVRESVVDSARVLSQYVDVLAIRTYSHELLEQVAASATIPVINALSDSHHPCQAMADFLTIKELKGDVRGTKLVFVGDGNNVARSLAVASALLGADFTLSCPPGYQFPEEFLTRLHAHVPAARIKVVTDPRAAVAGADVVYTDVWASMGQEHEAELRKKAFEPYQVNDPLLALAKPDAIFMHCLPAHREEEVTASVIDGPRSQVILQAANRLFFQMALLVWLIGEQPTASESPL